MEKIEHTIKGILWMILGVCIIWALNNVVTNTIIINLQDEVEDLEEQLDVKTVAFDDMETMFKGYKKDYRVLMNEVNEWRDWWIQGSNLLREYRFVDPPPLNNKKFLKFNEYYYNKVPS